MSFLRKDFRFGCPCYVPAWKWEETRVPGSAVDIGCLSGAIGHGMDASGIESFTNHIYVTVETLNSNGTKQTTVADVGFGEEQFCSDFLTLHDERLVMAPFYNNNEGLTHSYAKLRNIADTVFQLNKYKYLKILETLGYTYDPTNDYNITETSGDAEKDANLAETKTIRGDKVKIETAPEYKVQNFTTTYDDDTLGRLKDYSVNKYEGTHPVDENNVPIKKTTERYVATGTEQPGDTVITNYETNVSLTMDPITTPEAHRAKVHKMIRRGKMGAISIQELIQKQRDLVRISLEEEMLADIEKALLLNSWD